MLKTIFPYLCGLLLLAGAFAFTGCRTGRVNASYKTDQTFKAGQRVLVIAILPHEDTAARRSAEKEMVALLQERGYYAVSAVEKYGQHGLDEAREGMLFKEMKEDGIDAVMTVARIPQNREDRWKETMTVYPNSYYYNRIKSYRTLFSQPGEGRRPFFWEGILFDLASLQAMTVLRSPAMGKPPATQPSPELLKRFMNKMQKQKTLQRRAAPVGYKAF
ncbi:hypothetical protein JMG10_13550 [Nostoc ellipsosporum NOK]|jgi:hypothetical protein|nr:hypothetical protein [Nostoc ellipsosporum NOK]